MEKTYLIATFYKFVKLSDLPALQAIIKQFMENNGVRGTIYLAEEGINGTVSGLAEDTRNLLDFLRANPAFEDMGYKESWADAHPFGKIKVRVRKEIVSMGVPANPTEMVGIHVDSKKWNELLEDPNVVVVDTRNDYETHVGTFKNAVDPKTKTFKQLPDFVKQNLDPAKNKKVAMFCTGGIRCEKSTSLLKQMGFEEVYHLNGGILQYLEDTPKEQSLWEGDCFVFDERIAVNHDLQETKNSEHCPNCGTKLETKDRCKPQHIPGVQCIHCAT